MTPWLFKIEEQTFNFALTTKSDVKMNRWQKDGMCSADHLTVQDDWYTVQVDKPLAWPPFVRRVPRKYIAAFLH